MGSRRTLATVVVLAVAGLAAALVWTASNPGDDAGGSGAPTAGARQPERQAARNRDRTGPVAASCPPELSNCVVASGTVIYVEATDPDGDGDAHFVTSSRQGVTLPGITIFDVKAELRPDPLPGVGDRVGGAGPVYPGSHGQKQIEAIEFEVAR
ncbi:MAG: hypothetical protein KDB62_00805 [Solirubrobacterales bacterium]|nr:hypothetical protein [Solirubrobacterales bacterium]